LHSNPSTFSYFRFYLRINHPIYEEKTITDLISYFCFYILSPPFFLLYVFLSVIRFTREEILALRKVSNVLSSMTEFPDIISVTPLGPETLRPLEQDEVSAAVLCGVVWCGVV
jgi:hypothetical protein